MSCGVVVKNVTDGSSDFFDSIIAFENKHQDSRMVVSVRRKIGEDVILKEFLYPAVRRAV
jgi:hypothetical protein